MWKGAYEFFGQHPLSHNVGRNRTHGEVCAGNNRSPATIAATPFYVGMICLGLYLPLHNVDYDFPTVALAISNAACSSPSACAIKTLTKDKFIKHQSAVSRRCDAARSKMREKAKAA
jgi:hypothetical protein